VRALARRQVTMPFNLLLAREKFQQQPLDAFDDSLNQILSILGNQRLLLVLDEFSTLNKKVAKSEKVLTSQMFGFLSNTIQNTHQLTFIFTGTYMLLDMMRTHMYDLAKTCQPLMISFLDDASARLLIQEPLQHDPTNLSRGWLEYDLRVVDRIILLTHCHPYFIQYICMHLVSRMNELKYHRVNLNDLDVVVTDILTKPSHVPVMLNLWDEFVAPQHKVLSVIASLSHANQHGEVELNEIMNTLQNLGETHQLEEIRGICGSLVDAQLLKDVTSSPEQSESYQITIPLYQMWLKQNKSLHSVFNEHFSENFNHQ
jgi:hypothetical protein